MLTICHSLAEGKATILRRTPLEDAPVPPRIQQVYRSLFGRDLTLGEAAGHIVRAVREGGDEAVRRISLAFGDEVPSHWRVPEAEMEHAYQTLGPELQRALRIAAERIRSYHEKQKKSGYVDIESGVLLSQMVQPIDNVAVYAPGGLSAYPSSLLMAAIPAHVAGCRRIVLASPLRPQPEERALMLAAAYLAGITEVYQVGGAQAIAALAYGTETIAPVDKIVGPGNAIVVLAMRLVYGEVGIGGLPGPSEAFIIADDSAPVSWVAADMLTQTEHGPYSVSVLASPSEELVRATDAEMERQVEHLPRRDVIRQNFAFGGGAVIVSNLEEAFEAASVFAPEHLQLSIRDAATWLPHARNAGAVFAGHYTPVPLGDYAAGTNHILPVYRMARFASALGVDDFTRRVSILHFGEVQFQALAPSVIALADAEGLHAHAQAMRLRLVDLKGEECER
ncbi:MAG: histidinol dehydrogenase [Chloroflexi bacterium]|nr:histidinol dehydrogenase [Chloroflexota bacterium]